MKVKVLRIFLSALLPGGIITWMCYSAFTSPFEGDRIFGLIALFPFVVWGAMLAAGIYGVLDP
jgi:hypothetical protein